MHWIGVGRVEHGRSVKGARLASGTMWVRRVWVMLAEGPPAWVWVCGNRSRCWERPTLPSSEPRSRSRVSMCRM